MSNYFLLACCLLLLSQEGAAHEGPHSRAALGKECIDAAEARTQDRIHNRCDSPVALMWFCLYKDSLTIYHRSSRIVPPKGLLKLGCNQRGEEFALSWGACAPLEGEGGVMITADSNIGALRNLTHINEAQFNCRVLQ